MNNTTEKEKHHGQQAESAYEHSTCFDNQSDYNIDKLIPQLSDGSVKYLWIENLED